MVRLQEEIVALTYQHLDSFNSKMVRLQESNRSRAIFFSSVSIPKWCDCKRRNDRTAYLGSRFQFQNGAIARTRCSRPKPRTIRFNSKMVRLQVFPVILTVVLVVVSIPKWCDCKRKWVVPSVCRLHCFNSKMVRLQACAGCTDVPMVTRFNSKMVRLQVKHWETKR